MSDEMQPGRELDALIGRTFGFEPRVRWHALSPDGKGSAYGADTEREVRQWFEETLRRFPDSWLKDYHVGTWESWPRFSEEMGAAWKVVEKVCEQTKWYALCYRPTGAACNFGGFRRDEVLATFDECDGSRERAQALAICRAAMDYAKAKGDVPK